MVRRRGGSSGLSGPDRKRLTSTNMYYLQRKDGKELETVDQFDTRKEAREMVKEYQISDTSARFYISTRACKHWTK